MSQPPIRSLASSFIRLNAILKKILIVLWLLMPCLVSAASLSTVRNSRTFYLNYSSLSIKSLAFACLAMSDLPDDIPCQPALLRLQKKSKFAANGSISNGYQALSKARRILSNDLDTEFMNSLFNEDRIIEVETNPSMYFLSPYLGGKYLLYGLQFFSTQRNQANPELEVFAAESTQFVFQTAYTAKNWLLLGLQFRTQQDKIVSKTFRLVDLGTDAGKDLLKPKEHSRLFVEPGVVFMTDDFKLSFLGSGLVVSGQENSEDLLDRPELQTGISYRIPLSATVLELSMDYKSLSYEEIPDQKLHAGARLNYGAMSLLGGVDAFGVSGGMIFSIEKIYSGILYSSSQVPWRASNEYSQTVYIELGWQL